MAFIVVPGSVPPDRQVPRCDSARRDHLENGTAHLCGLRQCLLSRARIGKELTDSPKYLKPTVQHESILVQRVYIGCARFLLLATPFSHTQQFMHQKLDCVWQ